jgi:aspartate aminotransferase
MSENTRKDRFSEKMLATPPSGIRKFFDLLIGRDDIISLGVGEPDFTTPWVIREEAYYHLEQGHTSYTSNWGLQELRDEIAKYLTKFNLDYNPKKEILVTIGVSEAIDAVLRAILNPGDEIIVCEPCYVSYQPLASLCDTKLIHLDTSVNGFYPTAEQIEKVVTPKTKAIMICNPNNPTGYLYSKEELLLLGEIAKKHNLYLFADEVYREFCYDGKQHFSVMEMEDLSQHVILLDSVSKRYSACGARIGVIISKNKQIMNAALRMAQARLCAPYFGQIFGEAAVDTPQEYFDKVAKEYDLRRRTLIEAINKIDGCFCPMPTGAFYTILEMPIDDSDKFCQWLLEEFNYNGETVMLAPATGFYSDPEKGRKQARITYCLKIEDLKAAVKCLEEALKVYPGRTNK